MAGTLPFAVVISAVFIISMVSLVVTVRIAASEGFESFITGFGLEAFALKGNITELAKSATAQEAMKAEAEQKAAARKP